MARAKRRKREQARRLHQEPIVRRTAEILATGRPTLFRYESACRHGLRSALCLKGWKWGAANDHAALVVRLALARIGASLRPTWRVGQPDPVEREYRWCRGCGGYLDGGHDRPWCSEECRSALYNDSYYAAGRWDDAIRGQALAVILTGGKEPAAAKVERRCKGCGEMFTPSRGRVRGKPIWFCSVQCGLRADRHVEPRACLTCGEMFRPPRQPRAIYCSVACREVAYAARKMREREALAA